MLVGALSARGLIRPFHFIPFFSIQLPTSLHSKIAGISEYSFFKKRDKGNSILVKRQPVARKVFTVILFSHSGELFPA